MCTRGSIAHIITNYSCHFYVGKQDFYLSPPTLVSTIQSAGRRLTARLTPFWKLVALKLDPLCRSACVCRSLAAQVMLLLAALAACSSTSYANGQLMKRHNALAGKCTVSNSQNPSGILVEVINKTILMEKISAAEQAIADVADFVSRRRQVVALDQATQDMKNRGARVGDLSQFKDFVNVNMGLQFRTLVGAAEEKLGILVKYINDGQYRKAIDENFIDQCPDYIALAAASEIIKVISDTYSRVLDYASESAVRTLFNELKSVDQNISAYFDTKWLTINAASFGDFTNSHVDKNKKLYCDSTKIIQNICDPQDQEENTDFRVNHYSCASVEKLSKIRDKFCAGGDPSKHTPDHLMYLRIEFSCRQADGTDGRKMSLVLKSKQNMDLNCRELSQYTKK